MRTLVSRGLVEECGNEAETTALLYRTTSYFLERIGVASLDDLPDLAPFLPDLDDMGDLGGMGDLGDLHVERTSEPKVAEPHPAAAGPG